MRLQFTMQEKKFVDTNIFIYFLFPVDLKKHIRSKELLKNAELGEISLWTTEWVIAELAWFMQRKKAKWPKIKEFVLEGIFMNKGISVKNEKKIHELFEKSYSSNHFIDLINIYLATKHGIKKGYSYDKGFDNYKNFKRLEP